MSTPTFTVNKTVLAGLFKTMFADRDFMSGDLNLVNGESIDITIQIRVNGDRLDQSVTFHRNKRDLLTYDVATGTWIASP